MSVRHWNRRTLSIVCSRAHCLTFASGEFITLSILKKDEAVTRLFSIVSCNEDNYMEFLIFKVRSGQLSGELRNLNYNSKLIVGNKPAGRLVLASISENRTLWLIASGTGIAPFISILKAAGHHPVFGSIILVHSCEFKSDWVLTNIIKSDPKHLSNIRKLMGARIFQLQLVTKEPSRSFGMKQRSLWHGSLCSLPPLLSYHEDRVMVCGGSNLIDGIGSCLAAAGFVRGHKERIGEFAVEKAFEG